MTACSQFYLFPSPGSKEVLSVIDAPAFCGYDVNSHEHTLTVPFSGCNVKVEANCKVSVI